MASRDSDSDSDSSYGYDFTAEEEELISALVDKVSRSPHPPPAPTTSLVQFASRSASPYQPSEPAADPALLDIHEDDVDFDLAELESSFAANIYPAALPPISVYPQNPVRDDVSSSNKRRLSPSASDLGDGYSSLAAKTKPHQDPTAVRQADVQYPDSK